MSSAVKAAATETLFEIEKSGMDADLRHEVYQLLDRIEKVVREANERSDGRSQFPADEKTVSDTVTTTISVLISPYIM